MSRVFRSLAGSGLAVGMALAATVGCDLKALLPPPPQAAAPAAPTPGPPPETNNALILAHRAGKRMELTLNLRQLALLAFNASINNMPFPKDWDALIASDPTNKVFYEELRDAGVVVIWNAADYEKQVGASNTIVAYGPWVLQEGGPVATIDSRAEFLTADELKAKLAAMGVEPVEAAPAEPAAGAAPAAGASTGDGSVPAEGAAPAAAAPAAAAP
jgi:hypothetical protein